MNMNGENKSKVSKIVIISVIAVAVLVALLVFIAIFDKNLGLFPERNQEEKILEYEGEEYVLKDGIETFLIIGLDKASENITSDSYNNNQQADFMMLMVFDNNTKKYSTIHINRDTMAEVEILGVEGNKVGTVNTQIALAHTYGKGGSISSLNTTKAVSNLLYDVKVNHYMTLTLDSVSVMSDLVDGVTLEVLDDFTGIEGGENLIKGETVTLTPEEALLYVQGRSGLEDSTNLDRMERQKQFLDSMRVELEERIKTDNEFLADAVIKMSKHMDSDCSTARLQEVGERMKSYEFVEVKDIVGETKISSENKLEFYPDEKALKKLVIDLFYVIKK